VGHRAIAPQSTNLPLLNIDFLPPLPLSSLHLLSLPSMQLGGLWSAVSSLAAFRTEPNPSLFWLNFGMEKPFLVIVILCIFKRKYISHYFQLRWHGNVSVVMEVKLNVGFWIPTNLASTPRSPKKNFRICAIRT